MYYYTLHGLWPSNKGNSGLKVGENQLNKDWPSLEEKTKIGPGRTDNIPFWIEQWKNHGTCSVSILDQVQYFSLVLKMYNTINVRNILQRENVIPGGTCM
ncbi:ribonuclease T2 family protein [Medicago truncatula]|uniref:Ribonuclease T2 family protein n=1 Tax=Medicago truncatula TaxID=3880 RepID=G7IIB3_MEDTR|nr:ribonuclease T2 family protein [Medicago truncatula]